MCDLLSGWIHTKTEEIEIADLQSHSATQEHYGWKAADLAVRREWEWTHADDGASLVVRTCPDDPPELAGFLKAAILTRWPNRLAALMDCISLVDEAGGEIAVSGSEIQTLVAPNATMVSCYGCMELAAINLPKATTVYCSGCTKLESLNLPNATLVSCGACPKLITKTGPYFDRQENR